MASPNTSPPPGISLSLPKKRPPLAGPLSSAPYTKRRKPSTASASSHPLRQTSFPPPDHNGRPATYSPSQDDDLLDEDDDDLLLPSGSAHPSARTSLANGPASSLAGVSMRGTSTRGRGSGRGRGRPRGSTTGARGGATRAATTVSSVISGGGGRASQQGAQQADEESEDEAGGGADNDEMLGGAAGRERLERDKESRAMFLSALLSLSRDGCIAAGPAEDENGGTGARRTRKVQEMAGVNAGRYELWNRIHLKKEVVRRLTNQTLSQSVPGSVVTAINAYTKVFAGEIVSRALRVQEEWTAARLGQDDHEGHGDGMEVKREEGAVVMKREGGEDEIGLGLNLGPQSTAERQLRRNKKGWEGVREEHIGPLLPEHLIEALRRYKASGEGGVVGFTGMSLEGRENTAVRNGGRRLFR